MLVRSEADEVASAERSVSECVVSEAAKPMKMMFDFTSLQDGEIGS
jgi:hypothetical protein